MTVSFTQHFGWITSLTFSVLIVSVQLACVFFFSFGQRVIDSLLILPGYLDSTHIMMTPLLEKKIKIKQNKQTKNKQRKPAELVTIKTAHGMLVTSFISNFTSKTMLVGQHN